MDSQSGTLYVVATPIGNLGDITQRALQILQQVDRILAEDTRRTHQLLTHFGIKGSLVSLHDHNERQRIEQIEEWLQSGLSLALVSDAGTPLISDPGYFIVRELREREFSVVPIPGPSALVAALSVAGLPTNRFCFEGFLSSKSTARKKQLLALKDETRTVVFYESSHRIKGCVEDLCEVFGDEREMVIARELTKQFETVLAGKPASILDLINADSNQTRGEFVVMIQGADKELLESKVSSHQLLKELTPHLPTKLVAQIVANLTGESKKDLYAKALEMKL
ncbi:16S rRNA (cytidine(1402)-2'-O)-methyltransferase [Pleionea sediminis]|uniref:16S rRNA (cytidine(1402)-2'-O)-methyltransferase n=1 Tax=Pleionea sediminis TaxID=2569479 RepID=UPI0011864C3F|nr:16S rRNA (cytidine(1402)-2'-O)-methyltransferase [Pleionea sediminis]